MKGSVLLFLCCPLINPTTAESQSQLSWKRPLRSWNAACDLAPPCHLGTGGHLKFDHHIGRCRRSNWADCRDVHHWIEICNIRSRQGLLVFCWAQELLVFVDSNFWKYLIREEEWRNSFYNTEFMQLKGLFLCSETESWNRLPFLSAAVTLPSQNQLTRISLGTGSHCLQREDWIAETACYCCMRRIFFPSKMNIQRSKIYFSLQVGCCLASVQGKNIHLSRNWITISDSELLKSK